MARPAGQLHGNYRRGTRLPSAWRQGPRNFGQLQQREDAARECGLARWAACVEAARWRPYGRPQLEVLYPLGRPNVPAASGCEPCERTIDASLHETNWTV